MHLRGQVLWGVISADGREEWAPTGCPLCAQDHPGDPASTFGDAQIAQKFKGPNMRVWGVYTARLGPGLRLGLILQSPGRTGGSVSPRALSPQLQFSEVLVKWRRFFHQMAAEQGQAGRAALEMKLEAEKLQVRQAMSEGGGCAAGGSWWL